MLMNFIYFSPLRLDTSPNNRRCTSVERSSCLSPRSGRGVSRTAVCHSPSKRDTKLAKDKSFSPFLPEQINRVYHSFNNYRTCPC